MLQFERRQKSRVNIGDIGQAQVLFEAADLGIAATDGDRQVSLCKAGAPTQISQQFSEGRESLQRL